jgi:hypothetical protein
MNASSPYQRPVSLWSGTLGPLLPWPIVRTLLSLPIAAFALILCRSVALTGRPPRFWIGLEERKVPDNRPSSPFWRKSWQRPPRWLLPLCLALLAFHALAYAAVTSVDMWARPHTSRVLLSLVIVWSLALGVVGVLIAGWRETATSTNSDPASSS